MIRMRNEGRGGAYPRGKRGLSVRCVLLRDTLSMLCVVGEVNLVLAPARMTLHRRERACLPFQSLGTGRRRFYTRGSRRPDRRCVPQFHLLVRFRLHMVALGRVVLSGTEQASSPRLDRSFDPCAIASSRSSRGTRTTTAMPRRLLTPYSAVWKFRRRCSPEQAIAVRELDPTAHLALKDNQLTSQHGILSLESVGREENFWHRVR
jgi:hypothetical protein